ncbi:DMT family transporter [Rhizobium laguerreae]|uniref:DMT family transporter n=1 Tax=Rhizobium laguerreae TaxID=1076926 RepID=UPI001C91BFF7
MSINAAFRGPRLAARVPTLVGPSTFAGDRARDRRLLSIAGLGFAIVLWGANWPVMKMGLNHVTPLWFSALRFATGAACLFAVQMFRGGISLPKRDDLPFIVTIGILQMMVFTALGAVAMTHLPAGRSAILSYTTPLWVTPASIFFFQERVPALRIGGIVLAALGVAILVNPFAIDWSDAGVVSANIMLLAASLCWAVCILHLRYFKAASSAIALAPWQMLLATGLLVPFAFFSEGPFTGDGSSTFIAATLFVGPVATAFCFVAVNGASTWLPATTMSTAMLGVPVTGVALSLAFLGERMTFPLASGSIAIVAGIALNAMSSRYNSNRYPIKPPQNSAEGDPQ